MANQSYVPRTNQDISATLTRAQIWVSEVQYRYQNAPFGQMSQPVSITVRG